MMERIVQGDEICINWDKFHREPKELINAVLSRGVSYLQGNTGVSVSVEGQPLINTTFFFQREEPMLEEIEIRMHKKLPCPILH